MAPAMLAPAMMAKAEGIASTIAREMRQEIVTFYFNEDLDLVPKTQKHVFHVTVTPALISSIGCIGLAIWIIIALMRSKSILEGVNIGGYSGQDYMDLYKQLGGLGGGYKWL